jgi:hypothetical protein
MRIQSFIAVQNLVAPDKIPIAIGIMVFAQNFGGSLILTGAQAIFTNSLRSLIAVDVPGINPDLILGAGATGIRTLVTDSTQLAGVLQAYCTAVARVMYLGLTCSCLCFVFAWGLGWVDVRKKKKDVKASA